MAKKRVKKADVEVMIPPADFEEGNNVVLGKVPFVAPENLPVPIAPPRKELVLEGDPDAQLAYASKAAKALMTVVSQKPKPVIIRGKQYLEYGDWQVLARFYGSTVEIEWTRKLEGDIGYEARALVKRNGEVISSAEGMCTRDEERWKDADEYAVRSMAQTRTAAKALRNAFGWVAELAGYSATPAEEMPRDDHTPMPSYRVNRKVRASDDEAQGQRHRGESVIDMDAPPFETPLEQRKKIVSLLKRLGVDTEDRDACITFVGDNLELALEESTFPKVIEGLEDLLTKKIDDNR